MAFTPADVTFAPNVTAQGAVAVAQAYGAPMSQYDGAGVTIGIVSLGGGYRASDLTARGLNPARVTLVNVDGAGTPPNVNSSAITNFDLENAVDIQNALTVAPAANIRFYYAPNNESGFIDATNLAVSQCDVVTISWGGDESVWTTGGINSFTSVFTTAKNNNIPIFVASGDLGSADGLSSGSGVQYPASDPNATGCGGTTLTLNGSGQRSTEVAWDDGTNARSGGGVSSRFTSRHVPDVSGHASGYNPIVCGGVTGTVTGTSAVSPLFAGCYALLKQALGRRVDFLSALVVHSNAVFDVVSGTNGAYSASAGRDDVTGYGVPDFGVLLANLQVVRVLTDAAGVGDTNLAELGNSGASLSRTILDGAALASDHTALSIAAASQTLGLTDATSVTDRISVAQVGPPSQPIPPPPFTPGQYILMPGLRAYPGLTPPGPGGTPGSGGTQTPPGYGVEYDTQFYVGPLGDMLPLPGVESGVDTPLAVIGGTHTSLTGAYTRDVFGYKRSWTWTYPMLTDRQARHIEALQRNLVPGPLYLIDPRRRNRLPEQIASGGSLLRTPNGFIPSNTTATVWRRLGHAPADPTTLPARHILRGCLEWQLLAAGGASIELAGGALDGRLNIPVLNQETLRVSFWANGPASTVMSATVHVFDVKETEIATVDVPGVQLTQGEWRRVTHGFICPTNTAYLRLSLECSSTTPIGSIFLTALGVERFYPTYVRGLTTYCEGPELGDWDLGGGALQVVPSPGSTGYVRPGLQSSALTLIER